MTRQQPRQCLHCPFSSPKLSVETAAPNVKSLQMRPTLKQNLLKLYLLYSLTFLVRKLVCMNPSSLISLLYLVSLEHFDKIC